MSLDIRKEARKYFAENVLGPDEQTRVCLFLQSLKTTNAAILAKIEFQPFEWLPYRSLHSQYYKEIELSTLLGKATQWSTNPFLYMDATKNNLAFWQKAEISKYLSGFFEVNQVLYEYLALSHAFMSEVRFMPLLPSTISLDDPFLFALNEIEEENGRQIQIQIRLLKDLEIDLNNKEKQAIVDQQRDIVSNIFDDVLCAVCGIDREPEAE